MQSCRTCPVPHVQVERILQAVVVRVDVEVTISVQVAKRSAVAFAACRQVSRIRPIRERGGSERRRRPDGAEQGHQHESAARPSAALLAVREGNGQRRGSVHKKSSSRLAETVVV